MEHPTDLVDAFERIKDLEKENTDLKVRNSLLASQWDDLYEENMQLRPKNGAA